MNSDYGALFGALDEAAKEVGMRGLTDEQERALSLPARESLLLTAGAGSGKTKVLVERAVRLVRMGIDPRRIAIVSFTRKAAGELSERLRQQFPRKRVLPVSTTLHALALRCVAAKRKVELRPELSHSIVLRLRDEVGLVDDFSDADLINTIGRHREAGDSSGTFGLAALWLKELLAEHGADDFTSLMEEAELDLASRFTHVLVDEAQDLSQLQLDFISRVLAPGGAVWYVGDDDQAIYAFRGAGAGVLSRLAATVPNKMVLTRNFRCPLQVVTHANELLTHCAQRDPVTWVSASGRLGKVQHMSFSAVDEEVLAARRAYRASPADFVVLGRTNKGLLPFIDAQIPTATVHESKGAEWGHVWVSGAVQGRFPLGHADIEEERRLFYVAMTRAKESLTLSSVGETSQFLDESLIP